MPRRARVLNSQLFNLIMVIYCYEINLNFKFVLANFGENFYNNILNIKRLFTKINVSELLINANFRVIKAVRILEKYFVNLYNNFCLEKVYAVPSAKSFFLIENNKKLIPWLKWDAFDYFWKKNKFQTNLIPYSAFALRLDFETFFFLRELRCLSTKSIIYNEYLASLHLKKDIGKLCKPACKDLDDYLRNFYRQIACEGILLFEFDSFIVDVESFFSQNVLDLFQKDNLIKEINRWNLSPSLLKVGYCLLEEFWNGYNLLEIWNQVLDMDYGVDLLIFKYKGTIDFDEIVLRLQFFVLENYYFVKTQSEIFFVNLCKKILRNKSVLNLYFFFDFLNYFKYDYFFYTNLIKNSIIFFTMGKFIMSEISWELLSKLNNSMFSRGISSYWYSLLGLFNVFHVYYIDFFLEVFIFGIEYYFLRVNHCDYESRFSLSQLIFNRGYEIQLQSRFFSNTDFITQSFRKEFFSEEALQVDQVILIKCFNDLVKQCINSSIHLIFLIEFLSKNYSDWNHLLLLFKLN